MIFDVVALLILLGKLLLFACGMAAIIQLFFLLVTKKESSKKFYYAAAFIFFILLCIVRFSFRNNLGYGETAYIPCTKNFAVENNDGCINSFELDDEQRTSVIIDSFILTNNCIVAQKVKSHSEQKDSVVVYDFVKKEYASYSLVSFQINFPLMNSGSESEFHEFEYYYKQRLMALAWWERVLQ